MFDNRVKDSIRFRFLTLISGILLAGTVAISILIGLNERAMLKRILTGKGQGLASYIAKLSQDPLIMQNSVQLDALVNEANKDEDVMYAIVQDSRGKTFTSQFASVNYRSPRMKELLYGLAKQSELEEIIAAIQKNVAVATISVPIMAGTDAIGLVSVGMSEYTINQEIAQTVTFILALNAMVMFTLGAVLFVAFKRIIFNPITDLVQATTRLARGDLATKVEARGGGEIRTLIDSFNRMAEDLEARTKEVVEAQEKFVREEKLVVLAQLAANVGNELRNPLGVMKNAVFFLQNVLPVTDENENVREYFDILKKEIENAERTISDFVDFFRARAPRPKVIALRDIMGKSIEQSEIPDAVSVQVAFPETLPPVNVDPAQMRQVFQNLITNAAQAMPGGGALRIGAKTVAGCQAKPGGGFVEISIADGGTGIAPEHRGKIFQPLFTTKSRGVGLGLAICKNFVEVNGGRIEVASELGHGTTFTVTLPADTKGAAQA